MPDIGIAGIVIIVLNILASLNAFQNRNFFNSWSFDVGEIIVRKDYKRMITSGFIHLDYMHLFFNMFSFFFFAGIIEFYLGIIPLILIYFGSLLGGSLLSLWLNRSNHFYRAVGASGAVSGIIFAAIAIYPGLELGLFGVIPMPGWAFALGFIAYSLFGMKNKKDNIGHEAHLGGAIIGMFMAIYYMPEMIFKNTLPIVLVTIPSVVYLVLLILGIDITRTNSLKIQLPSRAQKPEYYDVEDYYREKKKNKEDELNRILEKVSKKGIDSLSDDEKRKLDELSE